MKHTLESALDYLKRNGIVVAKKQIERSNFGIKTWGIIDYLCKEHGYRVVSS